jgi:hypothetical protein
MFRVIVNFTALDGVKPAWVVALIGVAFTMRAQF